MDEIIVFSVYEVTMHLRQVIESTIEPMYITGEISNFTHHSSGHMYFNLKDAKATMRCTFFRNSNFSMNFKPEDGMQVICFGRLTVYEKGGTYNLNVNSMQLSGQGDLARQFELLKKKLEAEGLFSAEHKQPLPRYPQKIGIVSSPTGAALQDIMNILKRRFPVEVILYPALVQGSDAPPQLIKGMKYFNTRNDIDLIILTRGGGSQEDLWAFNDEGLARAVFASRIPVISAVGHEIDFSISDFVADHRAPTPSAAAELAVPDKTDLMAYLTALGKRMDILAKRVLNSKIGRLQLADHKLQANNPVQVVNRYGRDLDMATMKLEKVRQKLKQKAQMLQRVGDTFISGGKYNLKTRIMSSDRRLDAIEQRVKIRSADAIRLKQEQIDLLELRLSSSSPKHILSKGYAIVQKGDKLLRSIRQIDKHDSLKLILSDGIADLEVHSTSEEETF